VHVHQNRTVLALQIADGFIAPEGKAGLFVDDTRILSRYAWFVDGRPPEPAGLSSVEPRSWLGYYMIESGAPDGRSTSRSPRETVELRLSRFVGDGVHEDVDLTSFTQEPVVLALELALDGDFADVNELEDRERKQRGAITCSWNAAACELSIDYRAEHRWAHHGRSGVARIERAARVRVRNASSPPSYSRGRIAFRVELAPQARWHACVETSARIEEEWLEPRYGCRSFAGVQNDRDVSRGTFEHASTTIRAPGSDTLAPIAIAALEQAKRDLAALRLDDLDHGERAWLPAAGSPIYLALFGRDCLTAAWQAALLSTHMLDGSLAELRRWQGERDDPWNEEQPGRLPHQVRNGPLAALSIEPWARHYGAVTTSAFYPVALSELWHWSGDRARIEPLVEPALDAIRWLNTQSDADRDGFYDYRSRSERPQRHQGWKDSPDAIVHEDGTQAEPPIATCEEQGFVYLAKLHMSELLFWLDRRDEARVLYREASELKERFNERFWMEDEGFFAVGFDREGHMIRSITSNPGHCLACGIVDDALVEPTAARLLSRELFSGWGVRTLSSDHPAYNPYSYHRGSVWPVEQATFALGLVRYGLRRHAEMIIRAQLEAAAIFEHHRLPELFAGHPRDEEHPFPALYVNACSPQAWSASALFTMIQSMLGLYPYAPLHLLLVDPVLPPWLPELTLEGLRVGEASATIRFARTPKGTTDFEVREQRGRLHVVKQPSPWSLTASLGERLKDTLVSLIK